MRVCKPSDRQLTNNLFRLEEVGDFDRLFCPSPVGEDMEPYEHSELGGVGEGLCPVDRADPLTQLQLGNKLPSFRNPLPLEREV